MDEKREKTKDSTRADNEPWRGSNAVKEDRKAVPTLGQLHRHTCAHENLSFDRKIMLIRSCKIYIKIMQILRTAEKRLQKEDSV